MILVVGSRGRQPKWRERNRARALFLQGGLPDVEVARLVGVSARSVGRWRRAFEDGTDWRPPAASSFGVIAGAARRRGSRAAG